MYVCGLDGVCEVLWRGTSEDFVLQNLFDRLET